MLILDVSFQDEVIKEIIQGEVEQFVLELERQISLKMLFKEKGFFLIRNMTPNKL